MLKIRLARHGRKKAPFYRVVLTEHTKPTQSGYKLVLGWYNPFTKESKLEVEEIKKWITQGAQPTERVAKILLAETKDKFFEKFFEHRERTKVKKKENEES